MRLQEEQSTPAEAAASGAAGAAQQAESKKAAKRARQRAEKAAATAAAVVEQASDTPAGSGDQGAAVNPKSGGATAKRGGAGVAKAEDAAQDAAELLRQMQLADERCAALVQEQKKQKQKRIK